MSAARKLVLGATISLVSAVLVLAGCGTAIITTMRQLQRAGAVLAALPQRAPGASTLVVQRSGRWSAFTMPPGCQGGLDAREQCQLAWAESPQQLTLFGPQGRVRMQLSDVPAVLPGPDGQWYMGAGSVRLTPGRYKVANTGRVPVVLARGRYALLGPRTVSVESLVPAVVLIVLGVMCGSAGEVLTWLGLWHRRDDRMAEREAQWRQARTLERARVAALASPDVRVGTTEGRDVLEVLDSADAKLTEASR